MKNRSRLFILGIFAGCICFFSACNPKGDDTITTESLLNEMIDRESVSRFPLPSFTVAQFSSYDPASKTPGNDAWFANNDRSYFLREEINHGRREYVMMDAEGPGAVVRFWMTFAGDNLETCGKGTLRIYIDGKEEPAYEGAAIDMTRGQWVGAPLVTSVSPETVFENRGHNIYFPIAYAENIKITYETDAIKSPGATNGGECVYYNIGYRTYPEGTKVKSYTPGDLTRYASVILKVRQELASLQRPECDFAGTKKINIGQTHELTDASKAVNALWFTIDAEKLRTASPRQIAELLRKVVLKLEFDGEQTLYMPVGEFFGTGYRLRNVKTWYNEVDPAGVLSAYWLMPFRENCKVSLLDPSHCGDSLTATLEISTTGYTWDDDRSMHFGGSWYQLTYVPTRLSNAYSKEPSFYDMNYVTITGEGVYMGDAVTLFNTANAWWGEGDEKIFVDGDKFPSFFGTGTEDYYGYAWCRPEVFTGHPFISQPDGSGNFTPGYTSNMRFRSLDAIPFREKLKFDMEMWHWASTTINFAPSTFYYVRPGAVSSAREDTAGMNAPLAFRRSDVIPSVVKDGIIEGEDMDVSSFKGSVTTQSGVVKEWSNHAQLWWTDQKVGDELLISFDMPEAKHAQMEGVFTEAFDYGCFDMYINDQLLRRGVDLYSKKLGIRNVKLGGFPLNKGRNTMRIVCTSLSKEVPKGLFGLDYLKVR